MITHFGCFKGWCNQRSDQFILGCYGAEIRSTRRTKLMIFLIETFNYKAYKAYQAGMFSVYLIYQKYPTHSTKWQNISFPKMFRSKDIVIPSFKFFYKHSKLLNIRRTLDPNTRR